MLDWMVAVLGVSLAVISAWNIDGGKKPFEERQILWRCSILGGCLGFVSLAGIFIDLRIIRVSAETNLWATSFLTVMLCIAAAFCLTRFVRFLAREVRYVRREIQRR